MISRRTRGGPRGRIEARLGQVLRAAGLVALVASAPALSGDPPPAPSSAGDGRMALAEAPHVVRYELEASLDPVEHVVRGEGTIRWRNTSDKPVDHLWVHLYMNAFENDKTVFRRERVSGFRGNRAGDGGHVRVGRFFVRELGRDVWPAEPRTPGDPDDATDIRVDLGRSVAPGDAITIETTFETKLPSVALRAGYAGSFHMVAQWFPKIAKLDPSGEFAHFPYERLSEFYADFGSYRVTVDTPSAYVVGATGVEAHRETDGTRTRRTFEQAGVHDFAFAAWDRFEEQTREAGGVRIRCLYPPGLDAAAALQLDAAARGLAFFGETFGPYPYETLTIVHPPDEAAEAGGMEYPTLITTGGAFWLAHVPVLALEHLTLHELAHQWFYGIVATNENAFPFLDEGLTTYATGEAVRALYGHSVTSLLPVEIASVDRATRPGLAQAAPIATRASAFPTGSDYSGLVYARTATVLRTIDRVWDGAARRALGAYAREHRFGHPGPAELSAAIRAAGGDAAGTTFDRAVFERGWVDFEAASLWNEGSDEGNIARVTVRRRGTLEIPVEVELVDERGERTRLAWNGKGPSTRLSYRGGARAVAVVVDPDGKVLLDEDRANDWFGTSPLGAAPRTLTLASFVAALVLTVTSP